LKNKMYNLTKRALFKKETSERKFGLTNREMKLLKSLNTPKKIQDYLDKLQINFDYRKDTFMSPRKVIEKRKCHCIEGATLAYLALKINGYKPFLVHLKTIKHDYEHVLAVFKKNGKFGAITKTNHAVLRYREPVYENIRELVMSFFHEYFMDNGKKTLRSYSAPVNLSRFDKKNWQTDEKDLWYIDKYLDKIKHYPILTKKQIADLRKADKIEILAGKLVEWKRGGKRVIK